MVAKCAHVYEHMKANQIAMRSEMYGSYMKVRTPDDKSWGRKLARKKMCCVCHVCGFRGVMGHESPGGCARDTKSCRRERGE